MDIPDLENIDRLHFEGLTAQESITVEGQKKKIDLVEKFFNERLQANLHHLCEEILDDAGEQKVEMTRLQAMHLAETRMQSATIQRIMFNDGRSNLIIGKGNGPNANYTIMMPAHVDTFPTFDILSAPELEKLMSMHEKNRDETILKKLHWHQSQYELLRPMLELSPDPNPLQSDRMRGHGAWDMGAAALNNIALAADTRVPEGMQVYWVFTVDEEMDSTGAHGIIKRWPQWHDVDLVLSSEIGPLNAAIQDSDSQMRIVGARRGRAKMRFQIQIAEEYQGHAGVNSIPNAKEALYEWAHKAKSRFYKKQMVDGKAVPALQKIHPLLPPEKLDFGSGKTIDAPGGQGHPALEEFDLFIQMVPPSSPAEALQSQIDVFEELKKQQEWARYGISYAVLQHPGRSYPPYSMPVDSETGALKGHAAVEIVRDIIGKVTGQPPVDAGAASNADECLYADALLKGMNRDTFEGTNKGVITIPIRGNKAHNIDEWVSWSDTARVRHVMKMLLEDTEGLVRLAQR